MLIVTKFMGPTNCRGSRIKATLIGRGISATVSYDHALNSTDAHWAAAAALISKANAEPNGFQIAGRFSCVAWSDTGAYFAHAEYCSDNFVIGSDAS